MFWGVSKNDQVKLRARFGWRWCHRRPRAPRPGPATAAQHRGLAPPPPTGTTAWSTRLLCVQHFRMQFLRHYFSI